MSFYKLYYHFIWGTKNHARIILPEFEARLHSAIAAKVKELGGFVYAVNGTDDHIHLAASVPPKIAVARFIGEVKGNTSHFVNFVIKPGFDFYWQEEYGAFSFGEKKLSAIVNYIHNQKKHHADGTLQSILEKTNDE
jgi:REP element-mobilizing transposase RayT